MIRAISTLCSSNTTFNNVSSRNHIIPIPEDTNVPSALKVIRVGDSEGILVIVEEYSNVENSVMLSVPVRIGDQFTLRTKVVNKNTKMDIDLVKEVIKN